MFQPKNKKKRQLAFLFFYNFFYNSCYGVKKKFVCFKENVT